MPDPVSNAAHSDRGPTWCWSLYRGATCLIAAGHKSGHAGSDLDGSWLRWTDEDVTADALDDMERSLGIKP